MRFIDMFMAALGALIFMAMLLAYLVPKVEPPKIEPLNITSPKNNPPPPLQIITKSLPTARAQESYEIAFASRGGTEPIRWELSAGQSELPSKLKFDPARGTMAGIPEAAKIARFVVRARDFSGMVTDQAFELTIEPPKVNARGMERWLAAILIFCLLIVWLLLGGASRAIRQKIQYLRGRHAAGESYAVLETGGGVSEHIELPNGIGEFESQERSLKVATAITGWLVLLAGAFFIYKIWKG